MEQFFSEYWPHVIAVVTAVSAVARVVITKLPATAKYLKYVSVIVDVILLAGKAVKHAKEKSQTGSRR